MNLKPLPISIACHVFFNEEQHDNPAKHNSCGQSITGSAAKQPNANVNK